MPVVVCPSCGEKRHVGSRVVRQQGNKVTCFPCMQKQYTRSEQADCRFCAGKGCPMCDYTGESPEETQ